MIDINKAKIRILTLAYQGKLVDYKERSFQNTVLDELHSSIKKYVSVEDYEYLIDTPEEWRWSRLGYITNNHGQTTPTYTFSYIDVGTMDNINHCLSKTENIVEAKDAPSRAKKIVEQGDVLYSTVRPYLHNICIVDKEFSKTPIASTAFCVMHAKEDVLDNRFLFYWLLTSEFDKYSNGDPSKGALYPAIGEKDLLRGVIPVPSLDEQVLIANTIEDIFHELDAINKLQSAHVNNLEILKDKLMDAAIQGRLTIQSEEDGKVEDLLDEIKLTVGDNTINPIEPDEIPFEIPDNWKWCRLSEIGATNIGLTYHPEDVTEDGVVVIRSSNIQNGKMDYSDIVRVNCTIRDNQYLNKNDIVICARNGSKALVGKRAIFEGESNTTSFGAFMAVFRTICYKYVYYFFGTKAFRRYFSGDDSKQINQVTQNILKNAIIPIPPLSEQKRITDILDSVFEIQ